MSILSVISLKGGVSKTTVSINVAFELVKQGFKIVLVDADNQQSTYDFMYHREEKFCDFVKYESKEQLKKLDQKYDLVLIDNSPRINDIIEDVLNCSDYVLMLSKLSVFDYYSNVELAKLIKKHKKEGAFLLTQVTHYQNKERQQMKEELEKLGFPVLKQSISFSNDYVKSINNLKTLSEIKSSKVAEIQLLIKEITK